MRVELTKRRKRHWGSNRRRRTEVPPRESSLEPLPSFLSLDSARPAPALQNRTQRGAEAAYSASVSFEGGGVKIPRKRTTRLSGAFRAMLWKVAFMARIIPQPAAAPQVGLQPLFQPAGRSFEFRVLSLLFRQQMGLICWEGRAPSRPYRKDWTEPVTPRCRQYLYLPNQ